MLQVKSIVFPMVFIFLMAATAGYSQERETVSLEDLQSVYETVKEIASATAERRQNIGTEEGAKAFLLGVVEDQKLLETALVSMATTKPPKDAQLYAISVAIAAKETELALWCYINAFVGNEQDYINSGDVFLRAGIRELSRAFEMTPGE